MRVRTSTYLSALVLAALLCAGVFLFFQTNTASVSNLSAGDAFANAISSTTSSANSVQQPPNTKLYQSTEYHFSLFYPDDLSAIEHPGAGGSMVLLFEDQATQQGFDIFITPYNQSQITQQRFLMDEPSGVMNAPANITLDGAAATEFFSSNPAMGSSREIWFLHAGYLYEVTTPQPLDSWLLQIMQTWQFT